MDRKQVGEKIKYYREKINMKKGTLATLSGLSPTYISDLEKGNKCPTVETLSYICDALQVSLTDFFDEEITLKQKDIVSTLSPTQKQLLNDFLNSIND